MKSILLNGTDLTVSNVVMGTDSIGSLIDGRLSYRLLDEYTAAGGTVLDTAECYAHWTEQGRRASETAIGTWLQDRKNRHAMILSTKGGFYPYRTKPRLSEQEILDDLEGSLRCLKTDYIDLYWLHRDDPGKPVGEMMETLAKTVRQGKVRYIGVSNWTCDRVEAANRYAVSHGLPCLIASQIQYSPAKPNEKQNEPDLVLMNEREYRYFQKHDLTVFAFAAQAKGFFSKYNAGGEQALSPKARIRYLNDETIRRCQYLKQLSEAHQCTMGSMVVAVMTNQPDFSVLPIIGCKTVEQLTDSLRGAEITLSPEEVRSVFFGE